MLAMNMDPMQPVQPSFHRSTDASVAPTTHTKEPKIVGTSVLAMKYADGIVLAADNLGTEPSPSHARMPLLWMLTIYCTAASFGSLARFKDVQRIFPVGDNTLIAYSGDVSDAQHIQYLLETLMSPPHPHNSYQIWSLLLHRIREAHHQDDHLPSPLTIHNYLARTMYARRSKVDPLWNALLVAGVTPPLDAPMVTLPTTLTPNDARPPLPEEIKAHQGGKLEGNLFLGYVDLFGTAYSSNHIAT